mgnify:CR=1 FL=1
MTRGKAGGTDGVNIMLKRQDDCFFWGLEQRPTDDVKAHVGEGAGDHVGAAVVPVLAHLGDQDARLAAVVLLESNFQSLSLALGFLGLGIQEPMTSWGVLIQDGTKVMDVSPWILLFPGALLSITLYCFNFIGDGMRDALDPKDR